MYIEPNSTLYILKNVPLDTTYDHTLWFDTATAQAEYFSSLAKYRLSYQNGTAFTYLRVNRGAIKVPFKADALYDCNYIMFRNNGFGDKWFYAFIRSVEYVNNTTAEITFELDVMQTWHFDYTIDQCYVEREHSVTDIAGENTIPENVTLGDYVCDTLDQVKDENGHAIFRNWAIILAQTSETQAIPIPAAGGWYGNVNYQQVKYTVFPNTTEGAIDLLHHITQMAPFQNFDSIARVFMFPADLVPSAGQQGTTTHSFNLTRPTTLGAYVPKNKKLLTFPYTTLTLNNLQGKVIDYHWEYFVDPNLAKFEWVVSFGLQPSVIFYPIGYLQKTAGEMPNIDYRIDYEGFPDVPYATSDLTAKMVQAGIGGALSIMTGTFLPTMTETSTAHTRHTVTQKKGKAPTITDTTAKTTSVSRTDNTGSLISQIGNDLMSIPESGRMIASYGDTNALCNIGWGTVVVANNRIREEYAVIIDDYFSCYGYATKRVKTPNRNSRPHWNYVKTIGCTIKGSIPCDDMARVCNIYNNGITFWKHGEEVGNYSLDNSPT